MQNARVAVASRDGAAAHACRHTCARVHKLRARCERTDGRPTPSCQDATAGTELSGCDRRLARTPPPAASQAWHPAVIGPPPGAPCPPRRSRLRTSCRSGLDQDCRRTRTAVVRRSRRTGRCAVQRCVMPCGEGIADGGALRTYAPTLLRQFSTGPSLRARALRKERLAFDARLLCGTLIEHVALARAFACGNVGRVWQRRPRALLRRQRAVPCVGTIITPREPTPSPMVDAKLGAEMSFGRHARHLERASGLHSARAACER